MKIRIIIIALSILGVSGVMLLHQCSKQIDRGIVLPRLISKFTEDELSLDEIFILEKLIFLETNEQSALGEISQAKINVSRNELYILDKSDSKKIKVFNLDGKFLYSIGYEGEGLGGYYNPTTFDLIGNDSIVVASDDPPKLLFFNLLDNSFIRSFLIHGMKIDDELLFILPSTIVAMGDEYYIYSIHSLPGNRFKGHAQGIATSPFSVYHFSQNGKLKNFFANFDPHKYYIFRLGYQNLIASDKIIKKLWVAFPHTLEICEYDLAGELKRKWKFYQYGKKYLNKLPDIESEDSYFDHLLNIERFFSILYVRPF
ncbi:MAG: 6-bladed beta-propeller [candidate division KSB1 bacterium]|nr:6-bladed beta-propeller [candidate division KSB1 bacterium]